MNSMLHTPIMGQQCQLPKYQHFKSCAHAHFILSSGLCVGILSASSAPSSDFIQPFCIITPLYTSLAYIL